MNCKRVVALVSAMLLVFSLTACKSKEEESVTQESTTGFVDTTNETITENVINTEPVAEDILTTEHITESVVYTETTIYDNTTNTTTEYTVQETSEMTLTESTTTSVVTETTTEPYDDPAAWSKERIVEEYKNAARKSNSNAKSKTKITLKEISVNNGEYDKAMSFVKPIIAKFIESNSTENDGITGGFENLVPQDVSSAKAHANGNDTIIEMVMVEQTSGPKEDALSGSVGHAITAVGDISTVVNDLSDMGLSLELSDDDTKIYYTNPRVKVTVNENGEIVSGTWSYTVQICMNNFKAFGQNVEKASITMDNTITV